MFDPYYLSADADKLRSLCGTGDPLKIAAELDMIVVYPHVVSPVGAYCVLNGGKDRVIMLSDRLEGRDLDIVAAHELGHDRLHYDLALASGSLDDGRVLANTSRMEFEANAFASHLLIDGDEVYSLAVEYGYDVWQMAQALDTHVDLLTIKISQMIAMGYDLRLPTDTKADFLKYY